MNHSANQQWRANLQLVLIDGHLVNPRGRVTREVLSHTSVVDMRFPCVTSPGRRMGYRFMAAEAHWILSGDNRVETIAPYAKHISQFSDDGYRYQGAYGPKVTEQLRYVCDTLIADPSSRQAVINIWRENPRQTKDVPCTLNLQFLIRGNQPGYATIHTIANMRSSDLWLGWVYDVFNFTMITSWVSLRLRELGFHTQLGYLYLHAGSQHIYEDNFEGAKLCLTQDPGHYDPLDLSQFNNPSHLMSHLIALRDRDWATIGEGFLHELNKDA